MNHRVLVCGASSGIGRAIAIQFAKKGYTVFGLARRKEKLTELATLGITPIVADLDCLDDVLEQVSSISPIQILINNTGGPSGGKILEASTAAFEQAFSRHILASHALLQLFLPGMTQHNFGRIINIVSTSVYEPIPNLGVSNTIRAAMAGWSKSVSQELPPGITINNVLPGYTNTDRLSQLQSNMAKEKQCSEEDIYHQWLQQIPERRLATAEEIANAVLFLASAEASYIRGISLPVDCGRLKSI